LLIIHPRGGFDATLLRAGPHRSLATALMENTKTNQKAESSNLSGRERPLSVPQTNSL
jgi:hypothetical protein